MSIDQDTVLTTVYVIVDTLYQETIAAHKPVRRGHRPEMSDSEVLTLTLLGQWLGTSERQVLRHARTHWSACFPRLLSQSAFNRRARDLAGVLVQLIPALAARLPCTAGPYDVLDGVPVPLARIHRGRRHRVFADTAAIGRGGTDRHWYYGAKLELASRSDGVITGFVLGPANTEERWLADALLCWRQDPSAQPWSVADAPASHNAGGHVGPTGPLWLPDGAGRARPGETLYLSDRGLSGAAWQAHWRADYQAEVLTPRQYAATNEPLLQREHASRRQVIETVIGQLTDALHLPFPRARSPWGLLTRIAAKLAACNCAIWANRVLGRPDLAIATLVPG